MKWVAVAIVVSLALYTFLTLKYRRPGPAYRPYQDAQDRATTTRLLAGGWSLLPATVSRPVDKTAPAAAPAAITRGVGGLGIELEAALAEKPKLLASIDEVVAPGEVAHGTAYVARFTGTLPDLNAQLGDVTIYRRASTLVLMPTTEPLPGKKLLSRWNGNGYALSFPTTALPPGRYQVRLVSRGPAATWSFTVR